MSDVVRQLEPLIAHRTTNPGGDEPALARYLAEKLRELGAEEVVVAEPAHFDGSPGAWVYARWGSPSLLINAHIDTVPVNEGWTGDPFVLRVEDEKVIGLGACDTKGAIAAALAALELEKPAHVGLLFSGDEERGTACIRDFLKSPHARGIRQAIVCEPTGCRPGVRHRGILALDFSLRGHGGHSSLADRRPAPVVELSRLAVALHAWGAARKDVGPPGFPGQCVNVAKLTGGVAFNVIPEKATLTVSLRPPPGASQAALVDELTRLAKETVAGVEVSVSLDHPPFQTRDLSSFEVSGEAMDLAFWTEAALLAEAGIDAVVWGPGDIALAHAPDESVPVSELEKARDLFATLFARSRNHLAPG